MSISPKNVALNVVKSMVVVVVLMVLWSAAGKLMSAKSDLAVFAGLGLYLTLIGTVVYYAVKFWSRFSPELKKYLALTLMVGVFGNINGCTKVEPGYVGIKVNQYGSQRGVEDFPIVTGRVLYNPFTEDVYKFPTFLQNVVWTQNEAE